MKLGFSPKKKKKIAHVRVINNQSSLMGESKNIKKDQIIEALMDPKYYICVAAIIAQSITNAGITNFNALIINGFGYSSVKTSLMATPQATVALVGPILFTLIAYKFPNLNSVLLSISSMPALAGAIMVDKVNSKTHRNTALAGIYLMGFHNVPWVMLLGLISINTAGVTKKTFMSISVAVW